MDEDLYDEFGNYIGPEIKEEEEEEPIQQEDSESEPSDDVVRSQPSKTSFLTQLGF